VPRVAVARRRIPEDAIVAALARRYGRRVARSATRGAGRRPRRARPAPPPARPAPQDVHADLARRLVRSPSPLGLAQLARVCLGHPDDVLRVAAAATEFELASDPAPALAVLRRALGGRDRLARTLAAAVLARIGPEEPRLARLLRRRRAPRPRRASRTSLLVHGTFARSSAWWQPGGDFHDFLRDEVRPDLYGAADRFDWSGGWSEAARALGAVDLRTWVEVRGLGGLALFTHSHGGSVAMLASHDGLAIGELVLLSCPVHLPAYAPDFTRVARATSIRVHLDLVILVDGGGQRFDDPRIREHVLPVWFDHFASHDPGVWRDHDVPGLL
jgi:hypothetical protein